MWRSYFVEEVDCKHNFFHFNGHEVCISGGVYNAGQHKNTSITTYWIEFGLRTFRQNYVCIITTQRRRSYEARIVQIVIKCLYGDGILWSMRTETADYIGLSIVATTDCSATINVVHHATEQHSAASCSVVRARRWHVAVQLSGLWIGRLHVLSFHDTMADRCAGGCHQPNRHV